MGNYYAALVMNFEATDLDDARIQAESFAMKLEEEFNVDSWVTSVEKDDQ